MNRTLKMIQLTDLNQDVFWVNVDHVVMVGVVDGKTHITLIESERGIPVLEKAEDVVNLINL